MGPRLRAKNRASTAFATKGEQLALRKGLLLIEAFRAIRRLMPLQHAYALLHVALEEGLGVSEYAKRVGVTQAVMTRILFSLASGGQGRAPGYGLVEQARDPEDSRRTQSFLTAKGKALMRETMRLLRSGRTDPRLAAEPARDIARDRWLSRLVAAGGKLDTKEMKLAVQLIEALLRSHSRNAGLARIWSPQGVR